MDALRYNMMCVMITSIVSLILFYITTKQRLCVRPLTRLTLDIACFVIYFACSMLLIRSLMDGDSEQLWFSVIALLYTFGFLIIHVILLLLWKLMQKKVKVLHNLNFDLFIDYIQIFMLIYMILWHIIPGILSIWVTIANDAILDSDRLLLLVLCEGGILLSMLQISCHVKDKVTCYANLDELQTRQYLSFLRKHKHNHNRL